MIFLTKKRVRIYLWLIFSVIFNNLDDFIEFGGEGGARIMDLDQYLEKMNTNTKIIWIQEKGPPVTLNLHFLLIFYWIGLDLLLILTFCL